MKLVKEASLEDILMKIDYGSVNRIGRWDVMIEKVHEIEGSYGLIIWPPGAKMTHVYIPMVEPK